MPNTLVDLYRQKLADQGQSDDRDDYFITQELGQLAQSQAPELFSKYPDFAKDYDAIREANAPSVVGEFGGALKSGTQGMFSDLDSAAALAAKTVGLDKAADLYKERSKELDDAAAENAPTIPTVRDIAPGDTGASRVFSKDTARYLAAKAGSAIPSLAEIAGIGAAGAATGGSALAGEIAALGAGAFPLSAGAIYKETGRPDLAVGLGAVGALAGAAPVIGLPARVIRSLFPGLTGAAAEAAAKELVGSKTTELLAKLGRVGISEATGTAGMVGMEAANIIAKNITQGKDALSLDASDWNRLRESAIGGALASAPFAALTARGGESRAAGEPGGPPLDVTSTPAPPPVSGPTEVSPTATPRSAAQIYRDVRAMAPADQQARLQELSGNAARTPEEQQEFDLLSATAPVPPAPVEQPAAPAAQAPSVPPAEPDVTAPVPDETSPALPPPEAAAPTDAKLEMVKIAIAEPGVTYQYSVFPREMALPGVDRTQIDVISPNGGNLASTTIDQLASLGITLPRVPDTLEMGKYTPEQIKAASGAGRGESSAPTFKEVGFPSQEDFSKAYNDRHLRDVFETEDEFLRRVYCQGRRS